MLRLRLTKILRTRQEHTQAEIVDRLLHLLTKYLAKDFLYYC